MIKSGFILCLIFLFTSGLFAQKIISESGIQKISNGGLWFEYNKHYEPYKYPTVVFESGALSYADYWNPVIDSVGVFSNTIRYDRAGLGRSLASTDTVRSSVQIANELNELLDSLKVEGPTILVCHSAGGYYGRAFSHLFGSRVQSLVLIECPCLEWEDILRSGLTDIQNRARDSLLTQNRQELSLFERKEYAAAEMNRKFLAQIPQLEIPVFIIHGMNHSWPESYDGNLLNENWKECQDRLLEISTKNRKITVMDAGHHIFQNYNLSMFLYEQFAAKN